MNGFCKKKYSQVVSIKNWKLLGQRLVWNLINNLAVWNRVPLGKSQRIAFMKCQGWGKDAYR